MKGQGRPKRMPNVMNQPKPFPGNDAPGPGYSKGGMVRKKKPKKK